MHHLASFKLNRNKSSIATLYQKNVAGVVTVPHASVLFCRAPRNYQPKDTASSSFPLSLSAGQRDRGRNVVQVVLHALVLLLKFQSPVPTRCPGTLWLWFGSNPLHPSVRNWCRRPGYGSSAVLEGVTFLIAFACSAVSVGLDFFFLFPTQTNYYMITW